MIGDAFKIDTTGKIVLITGGYGYLGKAIVNSLLLHGATVIVLGRSVEKFNSAFPNKEERLEFFDCDVSSNKSVISAINGVRMKYERIDTLINNAFFISGCDPESLSDDEFFNGLDGLIVQVYRLIKEVIPIFKLQNEGNVINVSSMYGLVSPDFEIYKNNPEFLNLPHYGASKAAVIQLTRYFANYLGEHNVKVNSVSPGAFPSEGVQESVGFIENLKNKTALKRIGLPKDLAGIFTFLCSDAANYITGQNFIIDGGWTSK